MNKYEEIQLELRKLPKRWLITGVAGFIGSNLLEALLKLDQTVVGLDNFATGHQRNLDEVRSLVSSAQWARFSFLKGDVCCIEDCKATVSPFGLPVDFILHQAALGSVPRSIADPIATNNANINGFLNLLVASRDAKIKRFIYAASSSTYGDHPALPKVEDNIGAQLSPYAVTKYVNELYANVFGRIYGIECIGLRYFNVFGPRQDPNGAYAAVIPKWASSIIHRAPIYINGDGESTRDFCYVANVVQANLLAATNTTGTAKCDIFNVAFGERTTLNQLFALIRSSLEGHDASVEKCEPIYREFRQGDVRHSLASIEKAINHLGYSPEYSLREGLNLATPWYLQHAI